MERRHLWHHRDGYPLVCAQLQAQAGSGDWHRRDHRHRQEEDTALASHLSTYQEHSVALHVDVDDRLLQLRPHRYPLFCQPSDGPELS